MRICIIITNILFQTNHQYTYKFSIIQPYQTHIKYVKATYINTSKYIKHKPFKWLVSTKHLYTNVDQNIYTWNYNRN